MESLVFATSNTCVNNLKKTPRREVHFGAKRLLEKIEFFLEFGCMEEHTSGERSNEMHVHIDGKENEDIFLML